MLAEQKARIEKPLRTEAVLDQKGIMRRLLAQFEQDGAMLAASLLLARESTLAVTAINEEMDHRKVKRKFPTP